MTLDVFTFGEAMLRLSVPLGESLETAPHFDVHVAGSEANVAGALGQIGRRVAWDSRLPESALGRRVIRALTMAGVDCSSVVLEPEGRMGVYFVDLQTSFPARVVYDRSGSTASAIEPQDLDWGEIEDATIVHISGITPALSPTCRETAQTVADHVRDRDTLLSIDVNYRAKLWDPSDAGFTLSGLVEKADLVVSTKEDAREVFGIEGGEEVVAEELASRFSIDRVVITSGPDGAWWIDRKESGSVAALPVAVIDRLGAGDAFMAGVLDGVLDGGLGVGVRRGVVLAALALTTLGDQIVTTRGEMEKLMANGGRQVDR